MRFLLLAVVSSLVLLLPATRAAALYEYHDDFSDEVPGCTPSHWLQTHGVWKVTAGRALAPLAGRATNLALLHVFSRDCLFSADVTIRQIAPKGSVWVTGRWNYDPGYFIKAGYDHESRQWKIVQAFRGKKTLIGSDRATLRVGKSYKLTLRLEGDRAALYVDGQPRCGGRVRNLNWGKIGLYCNRATAAFDNVAYQGFGRVEEGVDDFWNPHHDRISKHPWFFHWKGQLHIASMDRNGQAYICPLNEEQFGSDNWVDWNARVAAPSHRVIAMQDGRLAAFLLHEKKPKHWTCRFLDSPTGNWSGDVEVFHPDETYKFLTLMPNKISQTEDGDLWLPSGLGNEESELFGDFVLHQSSDFGRTWQRKLLFRQNSGQAGMQGVEFGEAEVQQRGRGDLVCFGRRNQRDNRKPGSHGVIFSSDDGDTWSLPPASTPFLSARSSFNTARDPNSGEVFFLWVYEDSRAAPGLAHPRHRVSLASSKDNMRSWQFLLDLDDWKGRDKTRHYNPTLYLTRDDVYVVIKTRELGHPHFDGDNGKRLHFFRLDRTKLKPHMTWPPTHSTVD